MRSKDMRVNRIIVAGANGRGGIEQKVKNTAVRTLEVLGVRGSYLEIVFLGNKEMVGLKKAFLPEKKGPANVLAFPEPKGFPHPESPGKPLGVVYLNRGLSLGAEKFAFLTLHGILHLVGFRHGKKSDILKMEKLEHTLWLQILSSV